MRNGIEGGDEIKGRVEKRSVEKVKAAFGLKTDEEAIKKLAELQEDFRLSGPKGSLVQEYVRKSILVEDLT